jgi:hypothetical protein
LEIQEKLLRFLVWVAELILHDQFPIKGPIQIPDEFSLAAKLPTDPHWPSIAAATAEAPYRVPVQMDFVRLNSLLTAKRPLSKSTSGLSVKILAIFKTLFEITENIIRTIYAVKTEDVILVLVQAHFGTAH